MRRMKLLALSAMLILAGCAGSAGNAARERALLPALRSAWPAVAEDVTRGIQDGLDDGDLTDPASLELVASSERLGDGLATTLAHARLVAGIEWAILHPWADRGVIDRVDDGEIGPGVGESFEERIKNFDEDIRALQGRR